MARSIIGCVLSLAILLTAGCSGASPIDSDADGYGRVEATSSTKPSEVVAQPLPTGLMLVVPRQGAASDGDQTDVLIFSAETGELEHERTFPGVIMADVGTGEPLITESSFSDDGRYAAWASECDLHLAELNDRLEYHEVADWEPPQLLSQGESCFSQAHFVEDSTRIEAQVVAPRVRATGSELTGGDQQRPASVMSVDAQRSGDAPRKVEDLDERDGARETVVDVVGVVDGAESGLPHCRGFFNASCSRMIATQAEVELLDLTFSDEPDVDAADQSKYHCTTSIDDVTMLCYHMSGHALFGSAAIASVDLPAKTVELREAAPETPEEVTGALMSPDRKTLLIVTRSGWFRVSLDSSDEPQLAFEEFVDPEGRIMNVLGDVTVDPNKVDWISGE